MDIDKKTLPGAPQWYLEKLNMQAKAREIFDLKNQKSEISKQIEDFKKQSTEIDKNITELEASLLALMKQCEDTREFEIDDIVSTRFERENIGYTSDADVLKYLKEKYNGQYITTKVTEALDKNALKKAIKTDMSLAEALHSMTVKSITEYVVVTDVENHKLMLEHINEAKK